MLRNSSWKCAALERLGSPLGHHLAPALKWHVRAASGRGRSAVPGAVATDPPAADAVNLRRAVARLFELERAPVQAVFGLEDNRGVVDPV